MSFHLRLVCPKSYAPLEDGSTSAFICAVIVSLSVLALPIVVLPPTDKSPSIPAPPPMLRFSAIPTPPSTFNAPVVLVVDDCVELISTVPVISTSPPSVVVPLFTFNVPVDCMSSPSPFLSCKSPVPSFHDEPLAEPPVICKLPVSDKPNFAHAAPVQ